MRHSGALRKYLRPSRVCLGCVDSEVDQLLKICAGETLSYGPECSSPAPISPVGEMGGTGEDWWSIGVALARADLSPSPQAVLKNLAEALGSYYHCYSPETEVSSRPLCCRPCLLGTDQGRPCRVVASTLSLHPLAYAQ
jgi:hypothetical protein